MQSEFKWGTNGTTLQAMQAACFSVQTGGQNVRRNPKRNTSQQNLKKRWFTFTHNYMFCGPRRMRPIQTSTDGIWGRNLLLNDSHPHSWVSIKAIQEDLGQCLFLYLRKFVCSYSFFCLRTTHVYTFMYINHHKYIHARLLWFSWSYTTLCRAKAVACRSRFQCWVGAPQSSPGVNPSDELERPATSLKMMVRYG